MNDNKESKGSILPWKNRAPDKGELEQRIAARTAANTSIHGETGMNTGSGSYYTGNPDSKGLDTSKLNPHKK